MVGTGAYGFEVVGESHYQEALSAICGGDSEEGHRHECVARLLPEPSNPHDRNAVAVLIKGRKVAYLSRGAAVEHLIALSRLGYTGRTARCAAIINGGWDRRGRGKGHFGVELDLANPLEVRQ